LECGVGIALGVLSLTVGVVGPSPWFRLLIVAGVAWAASGFGVLNATRDWDNKSVKTRRRLVRTSHWCGLFPVLLGIGIAGTTAGLGSSLDPDDLGDAE
jgi:hypothetical protein